MGIFDEIDEKEPVIDDDKNRLFQTHRKSSDSTRRYLKLLGIFGVIVLGAGAAISYFTLPRMGDAVRAPAGLEAAIRDHVLVNEKRTATDIIFYYCESFYWAHVDVEKRPDIKTNPIYLIGSYRAQATAQENGSWTIASAPITSPEMDIPCK